MFEAFPSEIRSLPLVFLDLYDSFIGSFDVPSEFGRLISLKVSFLHVWDSGESVHFLRHLWINLRAMCLGVRAPATCMKEASLHASVLVLMIHLQPFQECLLSNNSIASLPESVANLKSLVHFDLSRNVLHWVCANLSLHLYTCGFFRLGVDFDFVCRKGKFAKCT